MPCLLFHDLDHFEEYQYLVLTTQSELHCCMNILFEVTEVEEHRTLSEHLDSNLVPDRFNAGSLTFLICFKVGIMPPFIKVIYDKA